MIKNDFLRTGNIPAFRCEDNDGAITLDSIKKLIFDQMNKYGIPLLIKDDIIKSGGLLNSSKTPCIVIYNKNHQKDYIKYCITVQKQGVFSLITTYMWGYSQLQVDAAFAEDRRRSSTLGMIFAKGPSQQKISEEGNYYSILEDCIISIFDKDIAELVSILNLI